jgi:hypothetical protein
MYTNTKGNNWDQFVPSVLFAYRVQPTDSIKVSPFQALYGREARLPVDTLLLKQSDGYTVPDDFMAETIDRLRVIHDQITDNLRKAQEKMKEIHDRKAQAPKFAVGDQVLLHHPAVKPGLSKKFHRPWRGPYIVSQIIPPATYKLSYLSGEFLPNTIHANRLKPFVARKAAPPQRPDSPPPLLVDSDSDGNLPGDNQVYDIESIVDRRTKRGKKEYLIHWAGFSEKHRTWEPATNIFDKALIADFEASYVPKTKRLSKHFKGKP